MKCYSGNASFTFEIERYRDRETGEIVLENDLPDSDDEFEFERVLISLDVKGYSYYRPGKYDGPWEDSYPDDGETEIESVTDDEGADWLPLLTSYEEDMIAEKIAECAADDDNFDPPDRDDYDDF